MQTAVSFQNLDASPLLKDYVQVKLDRLDRLLDRPGMADVTLRVEKLRRIAEINLSSQWLKVYASVENEDMHAAIDAAVDKLRRQITRKKDRKQDHRPRG